MKEEISVIGLDPKRSVEDGDEETRQNYICKKVSSDKCIRYLDKDGNFLYSIKLLDSEYLCVKNEGTECRGIWKKIRVNKYSEDHCTGKHSLEKVWLLLCVEV